jgi:anti-sigma factor RsiW
MNCQRIEKNLVTYLDSKANPSQRREVEAHLAECATCRERAEQFRLLWGVLDELPVVSPSPAFDASVRAHILREPRRTGFWTWLVPAPRVAFAVTALVVFSVWLSTLPPAHSPATVAPQSSEADFKVIEDLPVLENYDVLANFDALSELPVQPVVHTQPQPQL